MGSYGWYRRCEFAISRCNRTMYRSKTFEGLLAVWTDGIDGLLRWTISQLWFQLVYRRSIGNTDSQLTVSKLHEFFQNYRFNSKNHFNVYSFKFAIFTFFFQICILNVFFSIFADFYGKNRKTLLISRKWEYIDFREKCWKTHYIFRSAEKL